MTKVQNMLSADLERLILASMNRGSTASSSNGEPLKIVKKKGTKKKATVSFDGPTPTKSVPKKKKKKVNIGENVALFL